MKNIKIFENYISEKKGIHPAIYSHLENFFKKKTKGTFEEAKEYIKSKMKDWDLSRDDYSEARKRFC
jgi:hypothetical protein